MTTLHELQVFMVLIIVMMLVMIMMVLVMVMVMNSNLSKLIEAQFENEFGADMTVCNSLTSWTHSSDWHFKFSSAYFHLLCIFYSIASLDSVQSNLRINSELIPKGSNL